jgi:hypothetical protein
MQLKVIKSDGSVEEYMHTKVIGALSNALAAVGEPSVFAAEQLAEVVTFYLYQQKDRHLISSDEIHLMVQSVLTSTGFEHAAAALKEHRLSRCIKRNRVEVVGNGDGEAFASNEVNSWDKSRVVEHLIEGNISRSTARAIASMVEDKVLRLEMTKVPRSLIKQLVTVDTETMLEAEEQLLAVGG